MSLTRLLGDERLATALTYSLLTVFFILALLVRLQPLKYGGFIDGFDPYFHYYATRFLVESFKEEGVPGLFDYFSYVDKKFWYPEGRDFPISTFAGFYYTHLFIYLFLEALGVGVGLYEYTVVAPALYGALITVVVYLLARLVVGRGFALLAGALAGLTPSFMSRSSAGWYDNEPFSIIPSLLGVYFLFSSFGERKGVGKRLLLACLGGLLIGYSSTVWGGARYFVAIASIPIFLTPILSRSALDPVDLMAASLAYLSILALPASLTRPGLAWVTDVSTIAVLLSVVWLAINLIIDGLIKPRPRLRLAYSSLVLTVMAGGVMASWGVSRLGGRYLAAIYPWLRSEQPIVASVAEHQTTSGIEVLYNYGFLLPFFIVGVAYLLSNSLRDRTRVSLGLMLIAATYVSFGFNRLQLHLSYAIPIGVSVCLALMFNSLRGYALDKTRLKRKTTKILNQKIVTYASIVILLIALSSYYSLAVWSRTSDRGAQIFSSATVFARHNVSDWREALYWIRDNLGGGDVVVSWWDYGYWISVIGNKTTVVDNATINTTKIAMVAEMFLSEEEKSIELLKRLRGTHVVVFVTGRKLLRISIGNETTDLYQIGRFYGIGGDEGKIDWMIAIAGLDRGLYIGDDGSPTQYFWFNTTIGRMMPFKPAGYLQLDPLTGRVASLTPSRVPGSPYIQIPVYEYRLYYNETSSPFRLVFRSSGREIVDGFFAQVLIYEFVGADETRVMGSDGPELGVFNQSPG